MPVAGRPTVSACLARRLRERQGLAGAELHSIQSRFQLLGAGAIISLWNAPGHRQRHRASRAEIFGRRFGPFAGVEMAGEHDLPRRVEVGAYERLPLPAALHSSLALASSRPITATIPLGTAVAAFCIAAPRSVTRRRASWKSIMSAAYRAVYSPRLSPAMKAGRRASTFSGPRKLSIAPQCGRGHGEDGRLGDVGAVEVRFGALKAELLQRELGDILGDVEDRPGGGEAS